MTKQKRWMMLGLLVLAAILVWLFWPDRRVAQAKALQRELFSDKARSLTAEQRREMWQQLRTLQKNMTPAQREALAAEGRQRRTAEVARYYRMSPAEKTRHLDEQIRRFDQMQKQWQAKGGSPKGAQAKGGQPKGDRTVSARDQSRQRRLDSSSPAERALFAQYRKDLEQRRRQLGLTPRR